LTKYGQCLQEEFSSEIEKTSLSLFFGWVTVSLDKEICVEQRNIYFTVIEPVFHKLWQFETRHANVRIVCAVLLHFIPDPVFWIMWV